MSHREGILTMTAGIREESGYLNILENELVVFESRCPSILDDSDDI